jgi:dTDP-4-amino-4,6-dideoxygalactose transaminase
MISRMQNAGETALRFQRPSLPEPERIEAYFRQSRDARWFSNAGPCWHLLRERIAERIGAYCIPVASGTAGLLAAVAAVIGERGLSADGEALMPSFTFAATAQAAIWNGLRPRMLDVDPNHWHLDPDVLERELARRRDVAVVIAVSSFGTPPPAEVRIRWELACQAAGVPLVIDSAAAFGAVAEDGRPVGTGGDLEVVSFHATKPFAIGEGGAVFTRDGACRDRVEAAINFGFQGGAVTAARGLNGKLSELHAAVGLAVLDEFDEILTVRRRSAARIRQRARPTLRWQAGAERSTWQFVPVRFEDTASRDEAEAACRGVLETRVYYQPLHRMDSFAAVSTWDDSLEVTDDLAARLLALPMANDLSPQELASFDIAVAEHAAARLDVGGAVPAVSST